MRHRGPTKVELRRKGSITPTALRAEGIVDYGVVEMSAVAFVLTGAGLHLFHVECIAARGAAEHQRRRAAV